MRLFIRFLVGLVFVLALFSFACTYTVRFTETAVLTFFGEAGEGAVKKEPGLYFKLPYPLHSVTKYDTRVRTLTVKLETQPTADSKQVVVETFCNWRVEDPLKFFRRFSNAGERADEHYREAEKALDLAVRTAIGQVSRYTMDEVFTTSAEGSKLPELEQRMLAALRVSADKNGINLSELGIAAENIGLMRISLPEETTKSVFERMKTSVESRARATEARGNAEAQAIRSKAENDARLIRNFAERLAGEISAAGDREAAPFIAQMDAKPELAVFLSAMDFFRESYARRTTIVLSSSTPGVGLLFPGAMEGLRQGEIPPVVKSNWLSDAMAPGEPKANTPAPTPPTTVPEGRP